MEIQDEFLLNNSFNENEPYNEGFKAEYPITVPIILGIVSLLSLIGNILVVVITAIYMRLRSLTSIFIFNLAVSDLLSTAELLIWVCDYIWHLTITDAMCKFAFFAFFTGYYSNIAFLVLMSVWRYLGVVHPVSGWKKGCRFTLVLFCAWVVSILAALPAVVHTEAHFDLGTCTYSSGTAHAGVMYEQIIVFVCTFLFMTFCYIRILQTIFRSPTTQRHITTGLAFVLVATFFICWAPTNIVTFLLILDDHINFITHGFEHFYYASHICFLLTLTRCCLNPVIYGLFGVKFRSTVREIWQRRDALISTQMRMVAVYSGQSQSGQSQVPELDIKCDFSGL